MIREKKRYIGFVVESERELSRGDVISALKHVPGAPWLVVLEGNKGILRVSVKDAPSVRANIVKVSHAGSARVQFKTVITSGTIITVKEKLGMTKRRRRKAPKSAGDEAPQ